MKLGWCAGLKDAGLIKQAGYDYIELPLAAQDFSAYRETGETWRVITKDTPQPLTFEPYRY